jgi:hypothetical protein
MGQTGDRLFGCVWGKLGGQTGDRLFVRPISKDTPLALIFSQTKPGGIPPKDRKSLFADVWREGLNCHGALRLPRIHVRELLTVALLTIFGSAPLAAATMDADGVAMMFPAKNGGTS